MSGCPRDPAEVDLSIISSSMPVRSLGQAVTLSPGLPVSELYIFRYTDLCESHPHVPFCCVCGRLFPSYPRPSLPPLLSWQLSRTCSPHSASTWPSSTCPLPTPCPHAAETEVSKVTSDILIATSRVQPYIPGPCSINHHSLRISRHLSFSL